MYRKSWISSPPYILLKTEFLQEIGTVKVGTM